MKYLAILLSFIVISIIVLSACCLVESSTFDHSHETPCLGSCVTNSNITHFAQLNYFDFNKLLFGFFIYFVPTIISYCYFSTFIKKFKQNDFKILFYLNEHIQAGLLHPKIY